MFKYFIFYSLMMTLGIDLKSKISFAFFFPQETFMSNTFNRKQSERKRRQQSRKAKQGGQHVNENPKEVEETSPRQPEAASAAMELDAKRDSTPKVQAQEVEPQAPKDYAEREVEVSDKKTKNDKPLLSVKGITIGVVGMILLISGYYMGQSLGFW